MSTMNSTSTKPAILNHKQHAVAANHVLSGSSVGECYDAEERDGVPRRNEPAFSASSAVTSSANNDSAADEQEEEEARKLKMLEDDLAEAGDCVDDDVHYTFPFILHKMLKRVEEAGLGHIVSWQPCGACFRVHQPHKFTDKVMGKFFKAQTKFKSFQRQLHMYSFQRILQGKDKGAYEHKLFQRESPKLCLKMKRLPKKMRSKQKQQRQKEEITTAAPLKTKKGKEERVGARSCPKRPAAVPGKLNVPNRTFLRCGKIDPKAAGSSFVALPSGCYHHPTTMAAKNGTSRGEEAEINGVVANDLEHGTTSVAATAPACGGRQSRSPKTMADATGVHFPDFYPLLENGCFSAFAAADPLPMRITVATANDDYAACSRGIEDSTAIMPTLMTTSASNPQEHCSLVVTNPPGSSMEDMVLAGNASRSLAIKKTAMWTLLRGKQHMDQQDVGLGREADSSMSWRSTPNSSVIPQDSLLLMQEEAVFNKSFVEESSQPAPHQHRHHAGTNGASASVGIGGEEGIGGGVSRQLKRLLDGAAASVSSHRLGETTVATMPPPAADQMINDCLAFLRSRKLAPPPPTANAAKSASEKKDARGWASTGVEAKNVALLYDASRDHHEDNSWCMDDTESMDHAGAGDGRQGSVVSEEGEIITGPHNDDQNRTTMALLDIFEQRQSFPMMLTSMQQRKQEDASSGSATTMMQLELSACSRYEEPTRAPAIRVPPPTALHGSRHETTGESPRDYSKASPGVAVVLASPTCAKQSSISTIVSDHILSQRCVGRNLQHHGQSYHHPQRHGTQELQVESAQTNLMTSLSSFSNDGVDSSAWPCFHAKYPDFFEGKPFFPIEEEAS